MNELALFAGAGGGLLASKILGWRTVAAVEWSDWNACVLAQRQNDGALEPFPVWDDVRSFDGSFWRGAVDIISGGFPCQAFSSAARGGILRRKISGPRCSVLFARSNPGSFLEKTSAPKQSTPPATTLKRWVTKPEQFPWPRRTWVRIMHGNAIGFLHTPTTKANYSAESMQKWPCARSYTLVFGRPNPTNQEWLMGWPIGWSDIQPLETDRFHSWLSKHSLRCVPANNNRVSKAEWDAWRAYILS